MSQDKACLETAAAAVGMPLEILNGVRTRRDGDYTLGERGRAAVLAGVAAMLVVAATVEAALAPPRS